MESALAPVRGTFRAVATTLVPDASELDETAWSELEAIVEEALATRPAAIRRGLRLFLRAIRWGPIVRYGRTFTALGARRRRRVLGYLQDHGIERIRLGFWGLRTLVFMGYYGRPAAADAVGYRPHPDGWAGLSGET